MVTTRLTILVAAGALMLGAQSQPEARIYRAKATIRGAAGSGISGVVRFTQVDGGILPTVAVEAEIIGLQPVARHGFHIHERGNCSDINPLTGAALFSAPADTTIQAREAIPMRTRTIPSTWEIFRIFR